MGGLTEHVLTLNGTPTAEHTRTKFRLWGDMAFGKKAPYFTLPY